MAGGGVAGGVSPRMTGAGHDVVVPVLCARAAPREARLRTNNARFPNPRFYRYIAMIHTRVGGGLDQRR